MNLFIKLKNYIQDKYSRWKIEKIRELRTEEITKTLEIAHAAELANTPGELWPVKKAEHARQIAAVRDGDITIVDRRSWQFPYLPTSITRIRQPILKLTPFNIRRFMKSPVPKRALNLIKNGVLSLEWDIVPIKGTYESVDDDTKFRIDVAKYCFNHPNGTDSFQSLMEQNIEDFCTLGAMTIEPQLTPDPKRPFKLWSVDTSTIRIFPTWSESNADDEPRYAQMTGLLGERGIVPFMDDELIYIRDNPTNESPFGLGKAEVGFQAINYFLGVQEMSGRAGADQLHKTWLWWPGNIAQSHIGQIRRHITNDLEGQMKVSIVNGAPKPEVVEITPVQEADLLLNYQELLIRIICLAFDMSASKFLERDVNRSTGEVLDDADFRSAVIPVAVKISEGLTRFVLHRLLGWADLEFKFLNLDDPDIATKTKIQQQLYAMNAITANEIRASIGMPKLASKLADLTQIELIIANSEVSSNLANKNADQAAQRNLAVQQQQMEMYQQNQPQGDQDDQDQNNGSDKDNQNDQFASAVSSLKQPSMQSLKTPKLSVPKLSTPKLPMAGCTLNAKQVAAMSPRQLDVAISRGQVTSDIKLLCDQMETQEPGILEQINEQLSQYLETLQQEQADKEDESNPKITPKDKAAQVKRYKEFQHKTNIIEQDYNVNKKGTPNRPGEGVRQQLTDGMYKVRKLNKIKNSVPGGKVVRQ